MDAQTAINKLVENLSFQVLTGPCKVHIANNVSKNATGTPVNVKIKLRHKDDKNNRDIFSMSKIENSNNANKLRLVNSDQTITSFNLLMDSDVNKKSSKKSQNKILHLFKPGVCLRNQNKDDDYTYMPESNKNKENNASKTEDKDEKEKFGLMKNYIIEDEPFDDPVRRPKMFLGKCKPGGCLDPPFDEDKYSYEPVKMNQPVKEEKYSTQKPSDVVQNRILKNAESDKKYLRSASKQQDSFVEKDITTGSLITYPPNVCNQPGSQKDSAEIKFKTKKQALPPNTNEYLQAFYTPPKSKETSISSKIIDIVENENVVVQNQNQSLKSLSKDSIMPTIGGPVAPVLPDTITLSTIESNLKNSENNIAEQKMNNNKEKISCNEINEAPVIFASPLIEEKISDNMVKCDNDNLRYLQIVSLPSEENFEEFPTSIAPSIEKSQDKEIKQGDEIFCKETNKDLVKNKDIIVIAPIKKSTDTNNRTESKSEINSTISKNKNSESSIDDKNMEILKLNPLKQEPEERMEITKNNSQIDSFTPPDDIKLKKTSSIKPNKPPQTVNQESFKIEKINAPGDFSFTLNTEDLSDTKTANDSHATIDTRAEQYLDKENSTILCRNQSPQVLFDSQQELIKKVSSHIENKEFTNDEIDSVQKMPSQNNIHNESKSDVFGRLSGKMSIASSTKQLQKEVQQKISSSSNVELSQTLKPDNGSIYKQDSKPIFVKTSAYNIHNFRDDIKTITKVGESVQSTDFYEKKMFNDDTKVRNEYIDNNYQDIGDNNISNDPKDILNITTVSTTDDIDRQNIPSSLNNDTHKEYPETVKIYSAADQTLIAAESIQINATNLTTNYIQKPNKDTVHQGDDEQYTATSEISRSTDKDVIKQKRLSKENEPDIKNREGKKERLPYHQAQRKSATSGKHADTKTMPTKLPNNNRFENNLIHLDFALHLSEDGNETVLKTFDSECLPESSSKTPILFKYTIKANEDKIKIPVNANTNIVLEIKNSLKNKKYTKGISDGLSPNENKETNAHTLSQMNIMLQETITSIYEQNLVPVETMIRELKEDVEALVQNQKNIKQMLKASKNKAKHITSNRRCGCYRK